MVKRYRVRTAMAAGALLLLPGCVSISATQRPVTEADTQSTVCPTQKELAYFRTLTGVAAGTYRDDVIYACVSAMDAKYGDFKQALHQEGVGVNLVGDALSLGLTSVASIAKEAAARKLAAGSAFVIGLHSSINKNVFYEQTLPALESSMEANRSLVLTGIVAAQKADPGATAYSLATAGFDLKKYQAAGDIYAAISALTKTANDKAAVAKVNLDKVQNSPVPVIDAVVLDQGVFKRLLVITTYVRQLQDNAGDKAKLDAIATKLGLSVSKDELFAMEQAATVATIIKRVQFADQAEQIQQIKNLEDNLNPLMK